MNDFQKLCKKRMDAGAQEHGQFKLDTPAEYWLSEKLEELADSNNYDDMAKVAIVAGHKQNIKPADFELYYKASKLLLELLALMTYDLLNKSKGEKEGGD